MATLNGVAAAIAILAAGIGCYDPVQPRSGVPTLDDPGSDAYLAVSAGWQHTCALSADSTAYCWGSNEFGQLGIPEDGTTCVRGDRDIPCRTRPAAVGGGMKFRRISAGGVHTCGIALDDRVFCWGDNLRGALGDPSLRRSATPIPAVTSARFVDLATGGEHTCALRTDGIAMCWGANEYGQTGIGSVAASVGVPSPLTATLTFASVSAGGARSCALTLDGLGYCWGRTWVTRFGGDDVIRPQGVPSRVQTTQVFRTLEGGFSTTCGVSVSGQAFCWESNATATIGDGSLSGSLTPQPVAGGISFVTLASATAHSCGLAVGGSVHCWGSGSQGELGRSPVFLTSRCGRDQLPCSLRPVEVSGYRRYAQLSVGQGEHSCALTTRKNVYCWGVGHMGQRGDGRVSASEWSPVKVIAPL